MHCLICSALMHYLICSALMHYILHLTCSWLLILHLGSPSQLQPSHGAGVALALWQLRPIGSIIPKSFNAFAHCARIPHTKLAPHEPRGAPCSGSGNIPPKGITRIRVALPLSCLMIPTSNILLPILTRLKVASSASHAMLLPKFSMGGSASQNPQRPFSCQRKQEH